MATKQQSPTLSFFKFLKEALFLPTHNPRLFAAVFSIIVTSSSLLLLGNFLAVQHLTDETRLDIEALNSSTNPRSQTQENHHLLQEIQADTRRILLTGAAYLLLAVIIGSAIQVIVLSAAVTTYSGELRTFGSLLGKVRRQLKGPLLTLAFVYALETAYVVVLAATAGLFYVMLKQHIVLLFVVSLLLVVASLFLIYFSILCSVAVVVAVAEPGCHGAGAVGRARRLTKGKLRRAMLLIFVTSLLNASIFPVYGHAKSSVLSNMASGWLLGFVYTVLMAAVRLFADCAMTVFYYECKGSNNEASATEYAMVSTKEQIDD
ncbi:hypothetical protein BS78_10G107500 [Paspalum vaginatum]|nr:hypothetical protein BS78_10G107500 [Paspalum vaginatum]